jgi:hypothetical protein
VWGNEPPHSQVNSHFGSWSPDGFLNFHRAIVGVKTHWIEEFFYIIKKILECRCLKWARMTHLGTSNTSYGQKKDRESNCLFDSRPLTVRNHFNFLACMWCGIYSWKGLDKGYNFILNHLNRRPAHKVMGCQNRGSPGTKWHLGVSLVVRPREYYKGEGGGFPQVQAVLNLVSPCLHVVRPCTKIILATQ